MLPCPKTSFTADISAPAEIANDAVVCREQWKVIGTARKSVEVKIKRKSFEMSNVSVFC